MRQSDTTFRRSTRLVAVLLPIFFGACGTESLGNSSMGPGPGLARPIGGRQTELPVDVYVNSLAWSPDGRYLAASDQRGHHLYLWNIAAGELVVKTPNTAAIDTGLTFTRDGKFILNAANSPDGLLCFSVFDGHTGEKKFDVPGTDAAHGGQSSFSADNILVTPDNRYVIVVHGSKNNYGVYEVGSWRVVSIVPFGAAREFVLSAALKPDGSQMVFGVYGRIGAHSGTIQVWDPLRGTLLNKYPVGPDSYQRRVPLNFSHVNGVAYSPDGEFLAIGVRTNMNTYSNQLEIRDSKSFSLIRSYNTGLNNNVISVSYHPSGKIIATTDGYTPIRIWDASSSTLLQEISSKKQTILVSFSPDGSKLVYGGAGGVTVVDVNLEH